MKTWILGLGLAWAILGTVQSSHAQTGSDKCQYVDVYGINGGGSGGFPSPLACPNGPKLELAHGEVYILIGRIYLQGNYAYFYIDYKAHPWLANQSRRSAPYYLIQGVDPKELYTFHNRIVRMKTQALGQIGKDQKGRAEYYLGLRPLEQPQIIR